MIKTNVLKSKVTPIITILLCCILYSLGYFEIIFAAPIVLLASSIEYGKGLFVSLGFQRNKLKAVNLLIFAPLVAGAIFVLYLFVLIPSVTYFTGQPLDVSELESLKGNLPAIIGLIIFVWISAGFGEELFFRGYLMRQFIKFFGDGKITLVLNIVVFGLVFGFVHSYQGITGQVITGILGALLAIIFYLRRYDLWFVIAVHGFFDTIALLYLFFGV